MSERTEMKKEMQEASKNILAIKIKELIDQYELLFKDPQIVSIEIQRTELKGFGDSNTFTGNVTVHFIEKTSFLVNNEKD